MDMPYFDNVYAGKEANQAGFKRSGGLMVRICGLLDRARCGIAKRETINVPLTLIECIKSNLAAVVCSVDVNEMALALLTTMSIPPNL